MNIKNKIISTNKSNFNFRLQEEEDNKRRQFREELTSVDVRRTLRLVFVVLRRKRQ